MRFPVRVGGFVAAAAMLAGVGPAAGPGVSAAPSLLPQFRGFHPNAASFLSPGTGFALGAVDCGPGQACHARVAATVDAGARWRFMAARGVTMSDVRGILFASARTGWLYGPQLWGTTDGGRRWRRLLPGTTVLGLVRAGTNVYAWVESVHDGHSFGLLYASLVGGGSWHLVRAIASGQGEFLASFGRTAWFGTGPPAGPATVWTSAGRGWARRTFTCPGSGYALADVAAASDSDIGFLCVNSVGFSMSTEGAKLLSSDNGGGTFRLAGTWTPTVVGDGGVIAYPPGQPKIISFIPPPGGGLGAFGRSADGGRRWYALPGYSPELSWNSLAYVTATAGWVVSGQVGNGPASVLLRTTDSGRTWHPVSFTRPGRG
jgi:hypothetical protein